MPRNESKSVTSRGFIHLVEFIDIHAQGEVLRLQANIEDVKSTAMMAIQVN
jgi:hypothetical protein